MPSYSPAARYGAKTEGGIGYARRNNKNTVNDSSKVEFHVYTLNGFSKMFCLVLTRRAMRHRQAFRKVKRMWSIASRRRNRRHKPIYAASSLEERETKLTRLLKPVRGAIAMEP